MVWMPASSSLRAVTGPNSRHTALIEDAFHVLIEAGLAGQEDVEEALRIQIEEAVYHLVDKIIVEFPHNP